MVNVTGGKCISRGALIVLEGCDRCGKSTQSQLLVEFLKQKGVKARYMRFPARESNIGKVINAYLTNKQDVTDECIHLLFAANRWEFTNEMKRSLEAGTTLVVDRYSYSGVAYSVAKGFNFDWCWAPERGLIRPDIVFYLKSQLELLTERGQYGAEKYEKLDFQMKVANVFNKMSEQESHYWQVLDAMRSSEHIAADIHAKSLEVLENVKNTELEVLK